MNWFFSSFTALVLVVITAIVFYSCIILFTRLSGLRSFSKMSAFDFATTVAFGSLLASTILTPNPPLLRAIVALAMLFGLQYLVALLRERSAFMSKLVDNQPLLLMHEGKVLTENLKKARVTEDDLRAKLREANVLSVRSVHAVVFEATGDVSVLHGDPDTQLDPVIVKDVIGGERFLS